MDIAQDTHTVLKHCPQCNEDVLREYARNWSASLNKQLNIHFDFPCTVATCVHVSFIYW